MHVRKNDIVKIRTGDDSGKTGKILGVNEETGRVLVEGVHFVWKHLRRSQQHPHGARIQKEAPIEASNVVILCQSCNKPTRVSRQKLEQQKGGRVRICKKCKQAVTPEA
jgi:large subunit ribosomal protein L24